MQDAVLICALAAFALLWGALTVASRRVQAVAGTTTQRPSALSRSVIAPAIVFFIALNGSRFATLRGRLTIKLIWAGRPLEGASAEEYLAFAQLIGLAAGLLIIVFGALASGLSLGLLAIAIVVGGLLAWLIVGLLDNMISVRRVQISRQFPYFLDLAVMTMRSGASLPETMQIYESNNARQALAEELRTTLGELRMSKPIEAALRSFSDRITAPQVQNILRNVIRGIQLGSPLAALFEEQASEIRYLRTQLAERAAEELKVKILGPSMLMMIAVFILILGPAIIEIISTGVF